MIKKILLFLTVIYGPLVFASTAQIEWQHFTSKPSLKEQYKDYLLLKGSHDFQWGPGPFDFQSHILMEYHRHWLYFNTPELFFSYEYEFPKPVYSINTITVHLGRKIHNWSEGDKYWNLGLWNPLIYWNTLHPETAGLIGSLVQFEALNWSADFFIGALHLPHSQPEIIIKDKQLAYTHSRWANILPSQVEDYNLNIYYSVFSPFLFDFLFQQSFLANLKTWSKTNEGLYWIRWSFADKPSNNLYYLLKTAKRVKVDSQRNKEPGYVDQAINALPVRQRILSAEWGLDYKKISAIFNLEYTQTKEETFTSKEWIWTHSRENFTYFSLILKYQYSKQGFIKGGWIRSFFEDFNIYQREPEKTTPPFLSQTRVLNGLSISWNGHFYNPKGLLRSFQITYQHSFPDKGDWLSGQFLFYITDHFYSKWTMDILGVGNSRTINENASFLETFAHNDYWTWSLNYDF